MRCEILHESSMNYVSSNLELPWFSCFMVKSFVCGEFHSFPIHHKFQSFQHSLSHSHLSLSHSHLLLCFPIEHLFIPVSLSRFHCHSICNAFLLISEQLGGSESFVEISLEFRFTFNWRKIGVGFSSLHFFTPTSWKVLRSVSLPWIFNFSDFCHF